MPMSDSLLVALKIGVAMTETTVRILYVIRDSHTERACLAFYSGGKRFVKPYLALSTSPVRHFENVSELKGFSSGRLAPISTCQETSRESRAY